MCCSSSYEKERVVNFASSLPNLQSTDECLHPLLLHSGLLLPVLLLASQGLRLCCCCLARRFRRRGAVLFGLQRRVQCGDLCDPCL